MLAGENFFPFRPSVRQFGHDRWRYPARENPYRAEPRGRHIDMVGYMGAAALRNGSERRFGTWQRRIFGWLFQFFIE